MKKTQWFLAFLLLSICMGAEIQAQIVRRNLFSRISPPTAYEERQGLGKTASATFQVAFSPNFPDSARQAFTYATNVWSFLLNTNQTIHVFASWDSLGKEILAAAGPYRYYAVGSDTTVKYPAALAEMMLYQNLTGDSADIYMRVNREEHSWYYGTDGRTPANRVDFVTIIMHEIMHGLGMDGLFQYDAATGKGSWGKDAPPFNGFGSIFDYGSIVGNNHGTSIYKLMNTTNYPNPSPALGFELRSNNVFFDGSRSFPINNNVCVKLHSPATYSSGSSIYHLDSTVFRPGTGNYLMGPAAYYAMAIHSPGEVGLSILEDLGWNVNRIITVLKPAASAVLQPESTYTITWTDNKGGAVFFQLLKKNAFGQFDYYSDIDTVFIGSAPVDSLIWTVSSGYDNGEYKLKMLDYIQGYAFSPAFIITNLPVVATPVFTPLPGYYTTAQSVEISCTTDSVQIYYTKDLSDPGSSPTRILYTNPINVDSDMQILAQAFRTNYTSSPVAVGNYYIGVYVPPPVVNPVSGTYPINTKITVITPPGTTTYYTACLPSAAGGCSGTPPDPGPGTGTQWTDSYFEWPYPETIRFKFRSYSASANKWSEIIVRTFVQVEGIRIAQLDENNNSFGEWKRWEGTHWEPYADTRLLPPASSTVWSLLASQDFKPGTNQKYNAWRKEAENYTVNHADISVSSTDNGANIFARFDTAAHATVQSQIIDGGSLAPIEFKDPWFIDSIDVTKNDQPLNRGMNAFFNSIASYPNNLGISTAFKGVFLNENPDPQNPNKPYYTVRAPADPLPGFLWQFLGWQGTNAEFQFPSLHETPVVFTGPDAVATAKFKAHMATSTPLSYGSQPKISRAISTMPHGLVYESAGDIYYLWSTDNGATWSQDNTHPQFPQSRQERISDGNGTSSHPSIETYYFSSFEGAFNKTYVVWEENPYNGTGYRIRAREKETSGLFLGDPITIYEDLNARPDAALPVVSSRGYVFWRGPNGFLWKQIEYYQNAPGLVPGTDGNSANLSVDVDGQGLDATIDLVWEQAGSGAGIKYHRGVINGIHSADWGTIKPIASNTTPEIYGCPVVVRDNSGNACIAWERKNTSTGEGSIQFCKVDQNGALSTITEFGPTSGGVYPSHPSLSHHRKYLSDQNRLTLVWHVPNSGTRYAVYRTGSGWTGALELSSTGQYAIVAKSSANASSRLAYVVSNSGPPYAIQTLEVPEPLFPPIAPTLASPANGATNVSTNAMLTWNASEEATQYHLQIGTGSNLDDVNNIMLGDENISSTSRQVGLLPNKQYYWRVRAKNNAGWGGWSTTQNLTSSASLTNGTAWEGKIRLTQSVIVPDTYVLTILPGSVVGIIGSSTLSVAGSLIAEGDTSNRITIDGEDPTRSYWSPMIEATENGSLSLKFADFKNKHYQVTFRATGALTVERCTFTEFEKIVDYSTVYGMAIEIYRDTAPTAIGAVNITNNTIQCRKVLIGGSSWWGGGWGVLMNNVYPLSTVISNNTFDSCYVGFYAFSTAPSTVSGNVFSRNNYGITGFQTNTTVDHNAFMGNRTGIYLSYYSVAMVQDNQINSSEESGVFCQGGSLVTIQNNTITGSGSGICATGPDTDAKIYSNTLSNGSNGVTIAWYATATIGKNNGDGTGGNTILNSSCGISIGENAWNVSIRHNQILADSYNQVGIDVASELSAVEYNTIRGKIPTKSVFGIYIHPGASFSFSRNTFSYLIQGVTYEGGEEGWYGFNYNNLESNLYNAANYSSIVVQSSNNWWGTTVTSTIQSKLEGSFYFAPFGQSRITDAGPYGSSPSPASVSSDGEMRKTPFISNDAIPADIVLDQNHPNPFNPSTVIRYQLPRQGWVKIVVYDILGRHVRTLVDQIQSAGFHSNTWNGNDDRGATVVSGLYIYRMMVFDDVLEAKKHFLATKKMILVR